jgi:hypothetical protein
MPQPSVGRIVHYTDSEGQCQAAVITQVRNGYVTALTVFPPHFGPYPELGTADGNEKFYFDVEDCYAWRSYTWHWPERED